nr:hypothetical protein [Tanacetum cinerariifolium]
MKRGFLSQKGSGGRRGVKEKHVSKTDKSIEVSKHVNINDELVAMDVQMNTPDVGPNPSLPTHEAISAGNVPGKPSYATVNGNQMGRRNTWGKYGLVRSMFSSSTRLFSFQLSSIDGLDAMLENGPWFIQNNPLILKKWHPDENLLKEDLSIVPIWVKLYGVPVTAFSEDGMSAIATKLGTPLMLDYYTSHMCMQSWGMSSYARVMIELRANVELKDNIVVAMPKITTEGHYICAGERKTMKNPSQTSRGVPVGQKMRFKPQKEYRPITKKPNASSSGNKKKGVETIIEVSNSNPFDVLNSVDNDAEFVTNEGTTNLIYEGNLRLLDNDGNPLVLTGIVESDSEEEVAFDETSN